MTILFLNYDAKGYPDRNIFAPPLKFAIFANMMDDNRTITYVSDSTSGSYSDYLWTTSRASEIPTPTDMAVEKSGATETKIKFGHKLYCTPGISIKTLAKHIGINSNYLSFYFNHVLGANFHQWLYTLRIEEAKRIILHNPGVKISEVASAVGIPVIYNFSRWFKSITGMTAVTWRNMCRAEIAEKSEKNREIVEDSDMMH